MKDNLQRLKQSENAKRSNLADWYANQFIELDMPSGLHVVVRDVDMEDLISNGSLPNSLMSVFPELEGMENKAAGTKIMTEHPESFKQLVDALAACALVDPKIGDKTDPENGIISLSDFRGKDKLFLFNWLNREAGSAEMRSFREGEDQPVETA
jgi:hypothetical protein